MEYQAQTSFKLLPGQSDLIELAVKLLNHHQRNDYCAYERGGLWHVGLGSRSSLSVHPAGDKATVISQRGSVTDDIRGSIADVVRKFLRDHGLSDGNTFGYVNFNYAAHSRGQTFKTGKWPLLSLFIPRIEVCLGPGYVILKGDDSDEIQALCDTIRGPTTVQASGPHVNVSTVEHASDYVECVANALSEIAAGRYDKVIASRAVELAQKIDIPGTLLRGRRFNNPARSFAISHGGFQATGFSPELVMLLERGKLVTEPLAGTRSLEGTDGEVERLRSELLNDPKEVVEHVISVREAIDELKRVCLPETVMIEDFMSVRPRGSVQHLGSRVAGTLGPGNDAWDAFNVLFPSITASGIPKDNALEAIQRLENQPRELYSGAVLLANGTDFLEAALVLRTAFQDASRQWIQAGAGIISLSDPQREFIETREKLASIAPFIVGQGIAER
ncbi:hypothetical protein DL771_003560 [Monosporascus sp. 5C6A]|nr:hypothetical protein DL771_003560 [Monosporascus sp. 5C6A]